MSAAAGTLRADPKPRSAQLRGSFASRAVSADGVGATPLKTQQNGCTMNWDAIGSVGTLIGSVAVFVTLIYLARQIRESNMLANSTMANEITMNIAEFNEVVLSNPHVASLLLKLREESCELTGIESVELHHLAERLFNIWIQGQIGYDNGHLTADILAALKNHVKATMETYPGLKPAFRRVLAHAPTLNYEVFEYFRSPGARVAA